MANNETRIQNDIMTALSADGALVWRQHVGKFRPIYGDPNTVINVGVPGMADVAAVVPVTITPDMVGRTIGVYVGLEIKTATGKQREAQKLWQYALKKRGGIYLIARSVEQARELMRGLFSMDQ